MERVNSLYGQGKALFDQSRIDQGAEYFAPSRLYEQARQAFAKAVAIGSGSGAGKAADAALAELPE